MAVAEVGRQRVRGGGAAILLLAAAIVLAGCGSSPRRTSQRDGPPATVPAHLAEVPDAEPRIETIRSGGPNKPYQALGRDYVPMTRDLPFKEHGLASWYGRQFHGAPTASGERYDMYAMTAAHPTLPIPSYARIRNPSNGREVVVRINDRGPFHSGRIVDLSYTAALKLDLLRGVAPVELERITFDSIRAGQWRHAGETGAPPVAPLAAPPTSPLPSPSMTPSMAPISAPMPALPTAATGARGFWVQLGAFRDPAGAESFQRRVGADVDWLAPRLATFAEASLFRVQAGPFESRAAAQESASRIRDVLGLVPLVVERP